MISIGHSIVREGDDDEQLPIHEAAASQSANVCKKTHHRLISESLRDVEDGLRDVDDLARLPIHDACSWGTRDDTKDTIKGD